MQILPWKEVPVYNGGYWKQITDDGVFSAAGYLSPEWINSFKHNERNYQGVIVNHFPAQFASMGGTAPSQFGTGLSTIGVSMSQLLTVLEQMLKDPKQVQLPPAAAGVTELIAELADISAASMSGFSPDRYDELLKHELHVETLIEKIELESEFLFLPEEEGQVHAMDGGLTLLIGAIGGAVSLIGTVWNAISSMQNDPGILSSPWGDYSNSDGSVTHVYAEWYQGSAVRLKWIWGNNERSVFIQKRSAQLQRMMDVRQLRQQAQGKLPRIEKPLRAPVRTEKIILPETRNTSIPILPMELIEQQYFTGNSELHPLDIVISADCPLHVKQGLDRAKAYIQQYTNDIRALSVRIPSKYEWARSVIQGFVMDVGVVLTAWGAAPPVGVGAGILIALNRISQLERDLELMALIAEIRTYKHAISEWAGYINRVRGSYPACFR